MENKRNQKQYIKTNGNYRIPLNSTGFQRNPKSLKRNQWKAQNFIETREFNRNPLEPMETIEFQIPQKFNEFKTNSQNSMETIQLQ